MKFQARIISVCKKRTNVYWIIIPYSVSQWKGNKVLHNKKLRVRQYSEILFQRIRTFSFFNFKVILHKTKAKVPILAVLFAYQVLTT